MGVETAPGMVGRVSRKDRSWSCVVSGFAANSLPTPSSKSPVAEEEVEEEEEEEEEGEGEEEYINLSLIHI